MRGRLAVAAAAAVLWGAAAAAPLVLTSQRVDLDATRGVVQAWQVRLTDGRRVLIAPQLGQAWECCRAVCGPRAPKGT